MSLYLDNGSNSIIKFQNGLPPNYFGPVIPGSRVLHFVEDSCQLIIQEITTALYSIRFKVYKFFNKISVEAVSNETGLYSQILLKGNLRHKIKGLKRIHIREDQFTMLWSDSTICHSSYEPGTELRTIDIFYSPGILQQLTFIFPALAELINKGQTSLLGTKPCYITPNIRDIIRQIMECPFDENTRQFYFDLKVRELLYLMLDRTYKRSPSRYRFTLYETASIVNAHKILLEDIRKKPLSLRMLSRAVALNEFKLKVGFRQLFGLSIFNYLYEARMEKARELLLTTNKPIKDICVLAGYPRMTNFITAFRKKFGYTPGSLRRT